MKKAFKVILWSLLGLVVLAVLLVATIPLWVGPVVRPIANAAASRITQTEFNLGHLALNPYSGRLELGNLKVGNPTGYSEPIALSLGSLVVVLDGMSVLSDCIHVHEVTLKDCFVSYLYGGENNVDNLTQIQMNVAGGKEKYDAAQQRKMSEKDVTPEPETEELKVVIDRLSVSGVRVKLQMLTIPIPVTLTLTDIGKNSGGATLAEVLLQVWDAILKSATAVGDGAAALGGLVNTAAGQIGSSLQNAGKATSETLQSAADSVNQGAQNLNEGVKKMNEGMKKVGDDVKKTADALKKMFKF